MKALKNSFLLPKHNVYKSEVFSLGIILLSAMMLQSCSDIYNYTNFEINKKFLDQKCNECATKYSETLINFIKKFLIIDEENR